MTDPSPRDPRRVRIVGPGRAGRALALALGRAGWDVAPLLGRHDDPGPAAEGVDLVVVAPPDAAIGAVARAVRPETGVVVAHLSGALGLDVLAPHERRAAVHPLMALPTPEIGAERLVGGWFAVAGDPLASEVVESLRGRSFTVADDDRALYHAAAAVASNHLVALLGQVERLAAATGAPLEAYLDLAAATLDNVRALGPAAALTGPAARGDDATIRRHLDALPADERPVYLALVDAARRLAGRPAEETP
ncbi:MAG TPA: Rossmann-like and DUF2520 domain-containing protein [Acidimicrobiales bacterium]|nr:Rossmann-like and DUF2520 domain-containing protein [Acidimicrobiales bacterium]